jgi:sulfur carrier protein
MGAGLTVQLNGQSRSLAGLQSGASLLDVVVALGLKADRIAVELNGEIAARAAWAGRPVSEGDRLEIVHFVGGGVAGAIPGRNLWQGSKATALTPRARRLCIGR